MGSTRVNQNPFGSEQLLPTSGLESAPPTDSRQEPRFGLEPTPLQRQLLLSLSARYTPRLLGPTTVGHVLQMPQHRSTAAPQHSSTAFAFSTSQSTRHRRIQTSALPHSTRRCLGFCLAATHVNIRTRGLLEDRIWLRVLRLQTPIKRFSFSIFWRLYARQRQQLRSAVTYRIYSDRFVPLVASWDTSDVTCIPSSPAVP